MRAVPCEGLGLGIPSQAFRAHFRWCVGAPVYETDSHCNHCNSILPREGNHAMECLGGSDRIGCHNAIRDILEGAGKEAGLGPVKEKVGVFANNQQKPADIYLPGFFLGQDACVDVTVRSPLVSTVVGRAALTSLVAASVGVEEKRAKYGHMLPNNVVLRVVALETFGGWHAEAVGVVRKMAELSAAQKGTRWFKERDLIVQRVAVSLARWGGMMLLKRKGV